ncbi:hypothetical protein P12x_003971 [Tundrisphaera lichenicola]|uniref:hypothetical protein n=1 Tax=Tundrisphaera lichenicola TaxID=2029860 RepID=UPI003EBC65B3
MATKRVAPKSMGSASPTAPLGTALLLSAALCYGLGTLFARGRLSWPPDQLLASIFTVAGCLALIGPIVLYRRDPSEIGLGELLWMAGGLIVWVFDLASIAKGEARSISWATPLGYQPMGLTILAILLATARSRVGGSNWAWTNVLGWLLGIFWVAMAATTLIPGRVLGLAMR